MGPQSYATMGLFPYGKPAPGPFPARPRRDILCTVRDKSKGWAEDPQKGKGEVMKKVMIVIFVLSLLGLVAVPVLAKILAGPDSVIGPTPILPGTSRQAGIESLMLAEGLIDVGIPFYKIAPPPGTIRSAGVGDPVQIARGTWRKAGVENPVQVARGTWRKAGVENPVQVAGFWRPPAPRG